MCNRTRWALRPPAGLAPACLLLIAGCDLTFLNTTSPEVSDLMAYLNAPVSDTDTSLHIESRSDNNLEAATPISFDDADHARIDAALDDPADWDAFDLGPAVAGERFLVAIDPDSGLGLAVALFNDAGDLLQLVRQRNTTGATYYFEVVSRADTSNVRLVVAGLDASSSQGSYRMGIRRLTGVIPPPTPQTIVLDFDGDPAVSIAGAAPVEVPPFDAARIDASFADQTDAIKQYVVAAVQAQFQGLYVTIRSSDQPAAENEAPTTIYFGTYNSALLGQADNIDAYNQTLIQSAIVFTDTFSLFAPLDPTVEEIAQALANIASHEAGHLLGLWHVGDPEGLMSITATASRLLRPQTFGHALLHSSVFPIGWQNDADLLAWAVGGILKVDAANQRTAPPSDDSRSPIDFQIDRRWLSTCLTN
jgi:hypothetical protein